MIRFAVAVYDRLPGIVRDDAMMSPLMIDDAKKGRYIGREEMISSFRAG